MYCCSSSCKQDFSSHHPVGAPWWGCRAEGSSNILNLSICEQSPRFFLLCQWVITPSLPTTRLTVLSWGGGNGTTEAGDMGVRAACSCHLLVPSVPIHMQFKNLPFFLDKYLLITGFSAGHNAKFLIGSWGRIVPWWFMADGQGPLGPNRIQSSIHLLFKWWVNLCWRRCDFALHP